MIRELDQFGNGKTDFLLTGKFGPLLT